MSSEAETEADVCCANCGAAEVDDIKKLEECTDCDLVKYCSENCRENHRPEHVGECANRKALLHDRKLFTQPDETHLGECPLCFLPLPLDPENYAFHTCCSEIICKGCLYANYKSNLHDEMKAMRCPFCREPGTGDDKEGNKMLTKRVEANDPAALSHKGWKCYDKGDYDASFEYYIKAAELGDLNAHYHLGLMYMNGEGVEKDEEKAVYHYEKAAIGGHPFARYNLACIENDNDHIERSVKHLIIAANLGDEDSMKELWGMFKQGHINKEDLDATLRTHQAAIDETKSEQRDAAAIIFKTI
jgi:tetratricopeptide (TPR) repeat protein